MASIVQAVFFIGWAGLGLAIVLKSGWALWIAVAAFFIACLIPIARFIFRR